MIGKAEVIVRKSIEYVQWRNITNSLELTPEEIKVWLQGNTSEVTQDGTLIIQGVPNNHHKQYPLTVKVPPQYIIVKEDTFEERVLIMDVKNFNWYRDGRFYERVYVS